MISAVARVMRPGCKADSALIIEGEQGCGKSSLIRILGGGDWFGDSLPTFGTKDASSYLRGRWIIELAELSNVSKAEVEEIKAFITRTEERYRPAYGRNEIVFQRQCVFAGTTNAESYLRDETGNRRFWPIKVGHVDLEGLAIDRDQLWAEAVALFKNGEQWHLPAGVFAVSEREQVDRHMEDPWTGKIADFLFGKTEVAISDIAIDGLNFDVARVGRADANRIVGILRLLGWGRDGTFTSRASARRNMARYVNKRDKEMV
jgi:predicted P-loop ATPase